MFHVDEMWPVRPQKSFAASSRIVLGITHAQTCLTLKGRIRAFREAGFAVTLVCSPGELARRLAREEDAELHEIPIRRTVAPFSDLISLIRLVNLLLCLRPSIVEFSTPKAGFLGSLAAWICRVPVRVYMLRGLKLETSRGLQRFLLLCTERLAACFSHAVLCNSPSLRSAATHLGIAPKGKLHLLGQGSSNGVNIKQFRPGIAPRREGSEPTDSPVIGFVGRLTRDKGIPVLLDAFARIREVIPSAKLLLVGWFDCSQDALTAEQQLLVADNRQIILTGFVTDTAPYYRAMDLLILPSWREGFPNAALEAAASGLPVVTTWATGCRDAVLPGKTGLLTPTGDAQEIAAAALKLLLHPDARLKMGRAARAWVVENFSHQRVLDNTVQFYLYLQQRAIAKRLSGRLPGRPPKKASLKEAFDGD